MTRVYTAKQIAEAKGCRKDSVLERLKKVSPVKLEPHPGQPIRWYAYASLPADMQRAVDDREYRHAHDGTAVPAMTVTAAQICAATGTSRQAVYKRLKGIAPATLEPHPGRPLRHYALASLPGDMQDALRGVAKPVAQKRSVAPEPGIGEAFRLLLRAIGRALRGAKP